MHSGEIKKMTDEGVIPKTSDCLFTVSLALNNKNIVFVKGSLIKGILVWS